MSSSSLSSLSLLLGGEGCGSGGGRRALFPVGLEVVDELRDVGKFSSAEAKAFGGDGDVLGKVSRGRRRGSKERRRKEEGGGRRREEEEGGGRRREGAPSSGSK
jgi:hypothetical protein